VEATQPLIATIHPWRSRAAGDRDRIAVRRRLHRQARAADRAGVGLGVKTPVAGIAVFGVALGHMAKRAMVVTGRS
jgi:hypothetical protein